MKKAIPLLLLLLLTACHRGDYTPKPVAYLRMEFPEKEYRLYDTAALPFRFEQPSTSVVDIKRQRPGDIWVDVVYPQYRGYLFLSYKGLAGPASLAAQVDTSYEFLRQHFDHSTGVDEQRFVNPTRRVFATTYHLNGAAVASTYQFWATDSASHFLRGALFLDTPPNNDSLAPLLAYLQEDIEHLLETLEWK